jgi:hypothetical protein
LLLVLSLLFHILWKKIGSEYAHYRVKFSNLPSNVTHDSLMTRLKINPKLSHHLILQSTDQNQDSPRMAYLIRQPLENKLRQQIDKWHNTSFSSVIPQKIQCQLEINQEYFDWNDSTDMVQSFDHSRCVSPVLSIQNTHLNGTKPIPCYSSTISTASWKQSVSKQSSIVGQSQVPRSLRSKSGTKSYNKY